jgi:hypothetical protein
MPAELDALAGGKRWAAPLLTLGGALALLGCGNLAGRSATLPQPSMLAYGVDANTSEAWLATPLELAPPGSWAADLLGPGAQAAVPEGGGPPEWMGGVFGRNFTALAAPAPPTSVTAPDVEVVADSRTGDQRRLDLRIRPASGTFAIRTRAIGSPVLSAALEGREIDTSRYRSRSAPWTLDYVAPPPEGFVLTLTVPSHPELQLDIMGQLLDLPASVRGGIPSRPPGVLTIHSGDQTIVRRRVRF